MNELGLFKSDSEWSVFWHKKQPDIFIARTTHYRATGRVWLCPVGIDFLNQAGDQTCLVVAQGRYIINMSVANANRHLYISVLILPELIIDCFEL